MGNELAVTMYSCQSGPYIKKKDAHGIISEDILVVHSSIYILMLCLVSLLDFPF